MPSIFDEINATDLGTYWTNLRQNQAPWLWQTLFPAKKQLSSDFSFYRGKSRAPKALAPSAFGAQAVMRDRQGFDKVSDRTRYFKEGKYIDEVMRQDLLRLAENATESQKNIVNNNIFDDMNELLDGAVLMQEIMRNQIVQTGKINVFGNGQTVNDVDYQMLATHRVVAKNAWGSAGSNPFDDIDQAQYIVGTDSDQDLTRAVMNRTTFRAALHDANVKGTLLYDNGQLENVTLTSKQFTEYMLAEYGIEFVVYDKHYTALDGTIRQWIPDGRVIMMPDGDLGNTIISTTPEEADLIGTTAADVSIVQSGIAISTMTTADPVNKKINVSQQLMPSFEQIDGVYILDVFGSASVDPTDYSGATDPTAPKA